MLIYRYIYYRVRGSAWDIVSGWLNGVWLVVQSLVWVFCLFGYILFLVKFIRERSFLVSFIGRYIGIEK